MAEDEWGPTRGPVNVAFLTHLIQALHTNQPVQSEIQALQGSVSWNDLIKKVEEFDPQSPIEKEDKWRKNDTSLSQNISLASFANGIFSYPSSATLTEGNLLPSSATNPLSIGWWETAQARRSMPLI